MIHSVHKTLPAMTQTALLHVNGRLIDRDRLRRFLRIYQSSSPSYVLMAGIQNALCLASEKDYFAAFEAEFQKMREQLLKCKVLKILAADRKTVRQSCKAGYGKGCGVLLREPEFPDRSCMMRCGFPITSS